MLTDTVALAEPGLFLFAAQLPPTHRYFRRDRGQIDLSLVSELLRQTTIALAHIHYAVPFDHAFVMSGLTVELRAGSSLPVGVALEVEIECRVTDVVRRGESVRSLRNALTFTSGGEQFAAGTGYLTVIPPRLYDRIRGHSRASFERVRIPASSSIRPVEVGASHPEQLVLDADPQHERSWIVRVDPTHSTFFDHPLDHVPGMLLIEAARQASRLALGRPQAHTRRLAGTFTSYLELDSSIRIQQLPSEPPNMRFAVLQDDHEGAVLEIEVED